MAQLSDTDEYPHEPTKHKDWRESYYFNFVDQANRLSGFSTIGIMPNLGRREFVFVLFYEDKREIYFMENQEQFSSNSLSSLSDGHLAYGLVTPLKEWHMTFSGDNIGADLQWAGRFPPYHFGSGSGTSWGAHFEQSCQVSGTVVLPGDKLVRIEGMGQRDKSWGQRDWYIEGWYALHAQFDSMAIALRRDVVEGTVYASGSISKAEGNVAIARVDLKTQFSPETRTPIGAETIVQGVDGSHYSLYSSLLSPTSFAKFSRPFHRGTTELFEAMAVHQCRELGKGGTGLLEWLFTHPKG